jgi:hypothetical protein
VNAFVFEEAVRRHVNLLVTLGLIVAVLALPRLAVAWNGWPFGPGAWAGQPWGPGPVARFPAAFPYGSRFYYPPGFPLSYYEQGSGETYCLSRPTGFYYVCGYSPPARDTADLAYRMPPGPPPPFGEQGLPPPSGVLMFRLPLDAEAEVDGAPVGLSAGLGVTSVPPGQHRVVVRASGAQTEHMVTVSPHAVFTVTPTAIVPSLP